MAGTDPVRWHFTSVRLAGLSFSPMQLHYNTRGTRSTITPFVPTVHELAITQKHISSTDSSPYLHDLRRIEQAT